MRCVHLLPSVSPQGGGPIEYARVMAETHAELGHESVFVTIDGVDDEAARNFPFEVVSAGPPRGFILDMKPFEKATEKALRRADVAVVHGLWTSASVGGFRALKAAGVPWVTFPHGMLDPYFRKIKPVKHWVKQAYWTLWQGRMLGAASSVLFTCEEEQLRAQNAFWGHRRWQQKVVSFCAADQSRPEPELQKGRALFQQAVPGLGGRDYLLFLSRIHPKKACDTLIKAFAKIAGKDQNLDLVIAGPDEAGWQPELRALSGRLGIAGRVHWPGMIEGATKSAAFADARAFVLPSHQENFGMVVAEALSLGTPVLISEEVNIWREIVTDGAGLARPDTLEGTVELLSGFLDMDGAAVTVMRSRARSCYDARFSVYSAARDLLSALGEARGR